MFAVSAAPIIGWGLIAIAGIAVLGGVAWWLRRWMRRDDAASNDPAFTLQDLREMRDNGLITLDEYDKMRAGILASAGARADVPQGLPRDAEQDEAA